MGLKKNENAASFNELMQALPNRNISFFSEKGAWVVYVLIVVFLRGIVGLFTKDEGLAWTITNTIHNVITYTSFHFVKGTPFDDGQQGETARLTHWEQLDYEKQHTGTRKFYTVVPIVLLIIANHYCVGQQLWFNVAQFAIILLAKTPMMHRIRIFGIGKY